jgi:hypothetical protein
MKAHKLPPYIDLFLQSIEIDYDYEYAYEHEHCRPQVFPHSTGRPTGKVPR